MKILDYHLTLLAASVWDGPMHSWFNILTMLWWHDGSSVVWKSMTHCTLLCLLFSLKVAWPWTGSRAYRSETSSSQEKWLGMSALPICVQWEIRFWSLGIFYFRPHRRYKLKEKEKRSARYVAIWVWLIQSTFQGQHYCWAVTSQVLQPLSVNLML